MNSLKFIFIFFGLSFFVNAYAKDFSSIPDIDDIDSVYTLVEQMPTFPGGDKEFHKFIAKNLKYPPIYQDASISGKIVVSFIVRRDGSISDIQVFRSLEKYIDEEAIRVVSIMPRWNPGYHQGKPVSVKIYLPIHVDFNR